VEAHEGIFLGPGLALAGVQGYKFRVQNHNSVGSSVDSQTWALDTETLSLATESMPRAFGNKVDADEGARSAVRESAKVQSGDRVVNLEHISGIFSTSFYQSMRCWWLCVVLCVCVCLSSPRVYARWC